MLWKTHVAFGVLAGIVVSGFFPINNKFNFFLAVIISSILPDLDHSKSKISNSIPIIPTVIGFFTKHRGIIHSIPFLVLLVYMINSLFGRSIALAIGTGYLSHLVADGLTRSGINFLHPFGQLRLQGFITTGGLGEKIILLGLLVMIGVIIVNSL